MSDPVEPDNADIPTVTFTQADVDKIVQDRLARETQKYADYDDLRAKAATAGEAVSALETEQAARRKAEQNELRLQVTFAKGLPMDAASRLQGSTQEELEADADALAVWAAKPADARALVDLGGGAQQSSPAPPNMNDLIRRSAGRA